MEQVMWLIALAVQRSVSGLQNMFGYKLLQASNGIEQRINTQSLNLYTHINALLTAVVGIDIAIKGASKSVFVPLILLVVIMSMSSVVALLKIRADFKKSVEDTNHKRDTHLWEMIATGGITMAAIIGGVDWIYVIVSVTLGQVFHKGAVNMAFDRKFLDSREITNDLSGKTFDVPTLGISIRRLISDGHVRLFLAIIGLVYVVFNEMLLDIDTSIVWIVENLLR